MINRAFSFLTLLLTATLVIKAQTPEEVSVKFPEEDAVIYNTNTSYTIKLKEGKPYIESNELQQIMYLSSEISSYRSRYGFAHSGFHKLLNYEAYTTLPNGKKLKVTEFKTGSSSSNSIFYDDVKEVNFDFPGVQKGAIGTLDLKKIHLDSHLLTPFYFSRSIPVINGSLKITFPNTVSIKYMVRGNNPDRINFQQETRRNETTYTFTTKNLAGQKTYGDAPDDSYYALHVVFYIEKYTDEKGVTINHLSNIDDLYRLNYSFVKEINKQISPELKQITDSLIRNCNTQEEKARKIYNWVQRNIKYVAFEAGMEGFIPREANLVCSRRFGDCKDISSILTVMLNEVKVPAYYTWIGTRLLPYRYSETPLPIVDNHMICTIIINGQYIFLDGTDANCVFGTPSGHIQSKEALIAITEKEYKIIPVPVPYKEKNVLTDSTFLELTEGGIRGNIKVNMSGYFAMDMYQRLDYTSGKEKEQYFKGHFNRGSNKFRLEKFEIAPKKDFNNFSANAQFDLQNYAKKVGDEWYLNLNLFKHYEHQEIDYPKRTIPVEIPFKFIKKYVTVLQIPDGYTISGAPLGKTFRNDIWGFEFKYEQKDKQLILTQLFENDHILLQPDKFQKWNQVLENLLPLYKETINLIKK